MQIIVDDTTFHSDLITLRGQKYPQISIERECIVKQSIAPESLSKDIFIENCNGYWRRLVHHFQFRGGFWSMLTFAKNYGHNKCENLGVGPQIMLWVALILLNLKSFCLAAYLYFYPFEALSDEALLAELSSNRQWKDGLIRCFEWHPVSIRCALSMVNDVIYVYSADVRRPVNHIVCLKNAAQRHVGALAWHPAREDVLAVASENRILLWTLAPNLKDFKVEVDKCLQVIRTRYSPLTSILFNNDGSQIFACSPRSSSLLVINLSPSTLEVLYPIQLVYNWLASPMVSLSLSPDNTRLLARTTSNRIRIFECKQWTSKCWRSNLKGMCGTAVWSTSGGRILLYASQNSSQIYALSFYDRADAGDVGGAPDKSTLVLDTQEVCFDFEDVQLGSQIQQLAWDKNSTRLAVSFNDQSELVAIFGTNISPSLSIWPLYTIKSNLDENSSVSLLRYHDSYNDDDNLLLSICWSSGRVSHVVVPSETKASNASLLDASIASPMRSLTSFCNNYSRLNDQTVDGSPSMLSPNTSYRNFSSSTKNIYSPRRTELFSPRVKLN